MLFKKRCTSKITIDLPTEVQGKEGIFVMPIADSNEYSGYVLCIQDNPINISDLSKIRKNHLHVKAGGVDTPYGLILFLLFSFWDIRKKDDKFTYEVLLNPSDNGSYNDYLRLDKQREWDALVVQENQVLNTFKFDGLSSQVRQFV